METRRRRHVVFKSPPIPKRVGMNTLNTPNTPNTAFSPDNPYPPYDKPFSYPTTDPKDTEKDKKKLESKPCQASIEIFMLTVGALVFLLPKSIEPLSNIGLGVFLIIVAGLMVLFTHYTILRASPDNMMNTKEGREKEEGEHDIFALIVRERLKCCGGGFIYVFEVIRWIILCLFVITCIDMLMDYLDIWMKWNLNEQLESVPHTLEAIVPIIFKIDIHNPTWWLAGTVLLACVMNIIYLRCEEQHPDQKEPHCLINVCVYLANAATLLSIIGTICKFAKRIDWSNFWVNLFSQNQSAPQPGLLVYASVFPCLCINFFNHIGGTSMLYKYMLWVHTITHVCDDSITNPFYIYFRSHSGDYSFG
jgi:hypothetical protein